jgi:hypothetical protein
VATRVPSGLNSTAYTGPGATESAR